MKILIGLSLGSTTVDAVRAFARCGSAGASRLPRSGRTTIMIRIAISIEPSRRSPRRRA